VSLSAAILLGLIQGLTEFLPVSSSGHLAVTQHFLPGFHQPGVLFDINLHLGTLMAVLIYFRSEIKLLVNGILPGGAGAPGRRLALMLIIGTIPAVVVGLLFGPLVEKSFTQLGVVGVGLLITGTLLLLSTRWTRTDRDIESVTVKDALTVGLLQSTALVPGISRSGTTIIGGLSRGLSRAAAARFSFLLSIPAILGGAVYEIPKARHLPEEALVNYAAGFIVALVVGYIAIEVVLRSLANRRFHLFGYYCLVAGGGVLVYYASNLS
jgi:undecaprenyl-diphosphatase